MRRMMMRTVSGQPEGGVAIPAVQSEAASARQNWQRRQTGAGTRESEQELPACGVKHAAAALAACSRCSGAWGAVD